MTRGRLYTWGAARGDVHGCHVASGVEQACHVAGCIRTEWMPRVGFVGGTWSVSASRDVSWIFPYMGLDQTVDTGSLISGSICWTPKQGFSSPSSTVGCLG